METVGKTGWKYIWGSELAQNKLCKIKKIKENDERWKD